jgi:FtsH-binding integral membrane protein
MNPAYPVAPSQSVVRPFMRNVYLWMTVGLFVTALVAFFTINSRALTSALYSPFFVWSLFFVQIMLVASLSAGAMRFSTGTAITIFLVYAASNGFTLSLIFAYYNLGTVVGAFITAAFLFLTMSIIGTVTRMNLAKLSTYLFMGLIGLIVAMIVNIFLRSPEFDLVLSFIGVILFTALTAADTQKLVQLAAQIPEGSEAKMTNLSIIGALTLYLNFINLFIFLLRIFGRQR